MSLISRLVAAVRSAALRQLTQEKEEGAKEDGVVPLTQKMAVFTCGHEGPRKWDVWLWGEKLSPFSGRMSPRENICPACQLEELKQIGIRCCLCGRGIGPGEIVALYAGVAGGFRPDATLHDRQGIGCIRGGCGTGAAIAGTWDGTQFIPMFADGASVAARAMANGSTIAVTTGPAGKIIEMKLPRKK